MAAEIAAVGMDHILTRLENLEGAMGSVTTQISAIKTTESVLVAGVSNFRAFQLKAAGTLNFLKLVAVLFSVLNSIALGVGVKVICTAWPLIKAGLVEYYEHHPDAKMRGQSDPRDVYTVHLRPQPQDAGLPFRIQ
jgi:hypothetical protein